MLRCAACVYYNWLRHGPCDWLGAHLYLLRRLSCFRGIVTPVMVKVLVQDQWPFIPFTYSTHNTVIDCFSFLVCARGFRCFFTWQSVPLPSAGKVLSYYFRTARCCDQLCCLGTRRQGCSCTVFWWAVLGVAWWRCLSVGASFTACALLAAGSNWQCSWLAFNRAAQALLLLLSRFHT